jgi:hypothetical protein
MVRLGFERGAAHAFEVIRRQAELGQDFLVGNALVMLQPLAGFSDVAGLFLRDRLVIIGCVCQSDGKGVEHDLKQGDNG